MDGVARLLLMIVDLLVTIFLEEQRTRARQVKNSSTPRSHTTQDNSATPAAGSKSKGQHKTTNRLPTAAASNRPSWPK